MKKETNRKLLDVTIGSFDGTNVCELVGIYILCFLAKLINKKDFDLHRDDGLLIYANCKQINQMRKNIIKIFKDIAFAIDVKSNFKIVDLIDIMLNLFINDLLL